MFDYQDQIKQIYKNYNYITFLKNIDIFFYNISILLLLNQIMH